MGLYNKFEDSIGRKDFGKGIYKYFEHEVKYDIIGDIHGCFSELINLFQLLDYSANGSIYINSGRLPVFLGDLTDRGPNSIQVVNLVYEMVKADKAIYIMGNHCNKLYRYLLGRNVRVNNGLETTVAELDQAGESGKRDFGNKFKYLYENASCYYVLDKGKLIVSHGGVKEEMIGKVTESVKTQCLYGDITGKKEADGYPERLNWAKNYNGEAFNVYGHTPVLDSKIVNKTINIDEGCVFGNKLAAFRYPELIKAEVPSTMPRAKEQWERMERTI